MEKRRMCPNCRAFVTTDDKTCPYCDVPLGDRAVDRRSPIDVMGIPHESFNTMIILLINVGLFVATLIPSLQGGLSAGLEGPSTQTLWQFGAMVPILIHNGQWWRLVTAGWLHGGIFHILMNGWALYQLGQLSEVLFGGSRFITIYLVSSFTGFFASYYHLSQTGGYSVGASAAICGLLGGLIALGTRERHGIAGSLRSSLIQNAILLVVIGFIFPVIDNYAHIGGFIGGFVVAYLAGSPTLRPQTETIWRTAAVASITATAYAFVRLALSLRSSFPDL